MTTSEIPESFEIEYSNEPIYAFPDFKRCVHDFFNEVYHQYTEELHKDDYELTERSILGYGDWTKQDHLISLKQNHWPKN